MNNEMLGKKILWIAVLAAVLVGCLAMNFGPGWLGGQASVPCLCATLVYILTVTAFLVLTCNYRPFARFSLILSLVTFWCAVCTVVFRLLHTQGILSLLLSLVFVSAPFYGFRFWFDWDLTYLLAVGISLAWLAWSVWVWRRHRKKQ